MLYIHTKNSFFFAYYFYAKVSAYSLYRYYKKTNCKNGKQQISKDEIK